MHLDFTQLMKVIPKEKATCMSEICNEDTRFSEFVFGKIESTRAMEIQRTIYLDSVCNHLHA